MVERTPHSKSHMPAYRCTSVEPHRGRIPAADDDADALAAGVPGGHAADQAAAADRDEHGVEIGRLLGELAAERALTEQRLGLIERVHLERAGFRRPCFARGERIGISSAADDEIGAV